MKKIGVCLLIIVSTFSFGHQIHAEEGTDITIGVIDTRPVTANTRILIRNEHGYALKQAAVFIQSAGRYYFAGQSDEEGICELYMIPDKKELLMIQCDGFEQLVQEVYRGNDREQSVVVTLRRAGGHIEYGVDDIAFEGLHPDHLYDVGDQLTFLMDHTGMEYQDAVQGDVRYHPVMWFVENHRTMQRGENHSFVKGFLGDMILEEAGSYSLYVQFIKERYQDGHWVSIEENIIRQTDFYVKEHSVVPGDPGNNDPNVVIPGVLTPKEEKQLIQQEVNSRKEAEVNPPILRSDLSVFHDSYALYQRHPYLFWIILMIAMTATLGGVYYVMIREKDDSQHESER